MRVVELRVVGAAAGAEHDVAALLRFEHEGEVLAAHGGAGHVVDARLAHHGAGGVERQAGALALVHGGGVEAVELRGRLGAEGGGDAGGDVAQLALQDVADLGGEPARGAAHAHGFRDDVEGVAALDAADRDHAGLRGLDVAGDDALEGGDDVGGDHHRVVALVRHGAVRALAGDGDLEVGDGGHDRAFAPQELAGRGAGPVVQAVDALDGEAVEQPFFHHDPAAAAILLGGLEDEVDGAAEVARFGQILGGAEQHGGVAVMAAGVHPVRGAGGVGEAGRLVDGQRVDVGAEADGAPVPARPAPRIVATTPVLAMPVATSSQPNSRSFSAMTPEVRTSSKPISGCWCRSRRQAVISGWNSAMRLMIGMGPVRVSHASYRARPDRGKAESACPSRRGGRLTSLLSRALTILQSYQSYKPTYLDRSSVTAAGWGKGAWRT